MREEELTPCFLKAEINEDFIALFYALPGAMGDPGRIKLFSGAGGELICRKGHMNSFLKNGMNDREIIGRLHARLAIDDKARKEIYLGFGNFLYIKDGLYESFLKATEGMHPGQICSRLNEVIEMLEKS